VKYPIPQSVPEKEGYPDDAQRSVMAQASMDGAQQQRHPLQYLQSADLGIHEEYGRAP